ncbi:MAG: hypothetical protein DI606_19425 [Sphingobium sp.]|nr:MAG: hypothetical protein DI606_19425 [Sphingobium sp.]
MTPRRGCLLHADPQELEPPANPARFTLALNGDPTSTYYAAQLLGYNASKAALNMLTVQLSEELRGTPVTVNSISPGFVKTDLNGHTGHLSVEKGARLPVEFALQGDDAVSGQFVEARGQTPW